MKTKIVVKVMNFHALLRVDSSRKQAEKYKKLEAEISAMINIITNNRNFILDKKVGVSEKNAPELTIYFGSDFGFCGSINSQINARLLGDDGGAQIAIGKKLRKKEGMILKTSRDSFQKEYAMIGREVENAVKNFAYSKINIVYNHFHNMSYIQPVKKCIYPLDIAQEDRGKEDFYVEGDINELLEQLIISYINYEIKIAAVNSFASENISRENATSQSLKKLEEKEEDEKRLERKNKNSKAFQKVIDSFMKKNIKGG